MFDGFRLDRVDVGEVTLRVRYGGEGEPVVLLHGHPRTHTTWHRVAPRLSGSFFVVCPDLRGYGQSTRPPDAPGHAQSSKRAMAGDVMTLMRHLGHDRFSVVGHDRGALRSRRADQGQRTRSVRCRTGSAPRRERPDALPATNTVSTPRPASDTVQASPGRGVGAVAPLLHLGHRPPARPARAAPGEIGGPLSLAPSGRAQ
jgi:pimeloyl-ACP methyl ester carboxylesterase